MPLISNDHMVHEYGPDDVVDESSFDRNYQPTSDHESDHNLTSNAYTESDDSDDSDDDFGTGHLASFDDEPYTPALPAPVVPVPIPGAN
jgi:hypothetical protein